jgi:hypothetical protein
MTSLFEDCGDNSLQQFTKAGVVHVFGEVDGSETANPTTQMGNGRFGSDPGSARISAFGLLGTSTKPNLYVYDTAGNCYDYGEPSRTGFHLGGPGA